MNADKNADLASVLKTIDASPSRPRVSPVPTLVRIEITPGDQA
jgi:hypothetical protein